MTEVIDTPEDESIAAKYWHDLYVTTLKNAQDYAAKVGEDIGRLERELQIGQGYGYEKGFLDGAQHQMKSSVDKAVNAMSQPEPWLLESTQTLAKTLAREFYPEVTQWECLNDLAGVISQIDNMTTGLMRKTEPVAWMTDYENIMHANDHARWVKFDGGKGFERFSDYVIPLYTAPPQRPWVGLTDEEIKEIWLAGIDHGDDWLDVRGLARAIEAKLKRRNT